MNWALKNGRIYLESWRKHSLEGPIFWGISVCLRALVFPLFSSGTVSEMGILGSFFPGKEDIYADRELGPGDPVSSYSFSRGSSSSVIVLGYREGLLHLSGGSGGTRIKYEGPSLGYHMSGLPRW